ncbi:MAG TPA: UDP-N-acetylglucosamine 2-epimerase (non-hydrolyzing), partial [Gemmatimonadales bacterium]|nr:UDP-N-acetylglucosamine 2-epimerase (non-hydrolyzing) [Gemmatimonadales bacterium]
AAREAAGSGGARAVGAGSGRRGLMPAQLQRTRALLILGTRPEVIKLAPVVRALEDRAAEFETRVVTTGQHDELFDTAAASFGLRVDVDLGIMQPNQDLFHVGSAALQQLRGEVLAYRPDIVLVQGDTASACFGALAGFFVRAVVGHVEAGLRSGTKWAPYPEEIFRRLADVVSDLHFVPTPAGRDNLLREGCSPRQIHVTGNTVVDAVLSIARRDLAVTPPPVRAALAAGRPTVLITVHRRESFGDALRGLFRAIGRLADCHPDIAFVYPVHPNPNVSRPAHELLGGRANVCLVEPLGYADLVATMQRSMLVLTDSGGLQEEAPSLGVPVLVLREVTERPEGIVAGVARLVGTDEQRVFLEANRLLCDPAARAAFTTVPNPYGDGRAAERIVDIIAGELRGTPRRTDDWAPQSLPGRRTQRRRINRLAPDAAPHAEPS